MFYPRILYGSLLALSVVLFVLVPNRLTLLLLCTAGFLPLVSLVLALIPRRKITTRLLVPSGLEQGKSGTVTLLFTNRSRLGTRLLANVTMTNSLTGTTVQRRADVPVAARVSRREPLLLLDAEVGRIETILTDLWVMDPMRLFRFRIPARQHGTFMVEPPDLPVRILMDEAAETTGSSQKYSEFEPGRDVSETFDTREYMKGDDVRSIHWKLSSKFDTLMVREYGKPMEFSLILLAELAESSAPALEACISYTAGISRGLLDRGLLHTIAWYDAGTGEYLSFNVTDYESLESAILRLVVSCPHEGTGESLQRFLADLTPSGRKKTLFYFTTHFDNDQMIEAADRCIARCAIIGERGADTADPALSVDPLPEDSRNVRALSLELENSESWR
ncbi:MAG: DUF58 domain-containing protein [Clostridia bacterium]|nr:DUF58 domain-containing protein [Clostridia bacterium]